MIIMNPNLLSQTVLSSHTHLEYHCPITLRQVHLYDMLAGLLSFQAKKSISILG